MTNIINLLRDNLQQRYCFRCGADCCVHPPFARTLILIVYLNQCIEPEPPYHEMQPPPGLLFFLFSGISSPSKEKRQHIPPENSIALYMEGQRLHM